MTGEDTDGDGYGDDYTVIESALSSQSAQKEGVSAFAWTSGSSKGFTIDGASEVNLYADFDTDYTPDTQERYVSWCWKLGSTGSGWSGGSSSAVDPTSEKFNASAGISLLETDGNDEEIRHSLGEAPEMIWAFNKGTTWSASVWAKPYDGYYFDLGSSSQPYSETSESEYFKAAGNNSITLGPSVAYGYDLYLYLFRSISGYSRVGTFSASGSSTAGPFVFCEFRPRMILLKSASTSDDESWAIYDSERQTYNTLSNYLMPDAVDAEDSGGNNIDILSNGFRPYTSALPNSSGHDYLYYAVGDPLKFSTAR